MKEVKEENEIRLQDGGLDDDGLRKYRGEDAVRGGAGEELPRIRLQNKGSRPDNVVQKEFQTEEECEQIQSELPSFMRGFFVYMRQSLLPMSRLAYLHDIRFFCQYLIAQTDLTEASETSKIKASDFDAVRGADVAGKCMDYTSLTGEYPEAVAAFGDNRLRLAWTRRLLDAGYRVPSVVHPTAIVSPSAVCCTGPSSTPILCWARHAL